MSFSWICINSQRVHSESHKAESSVCTAYLQYVALLSTPQLNTPQSMMSKQVLSLSQLIKKAQVGVWPEVQYAFLNLVKLRLKLLADLSLPGKQ